MYRCERHAAINTSLIVPRVLALAAFLTAMRCVKQARSFGLGLTYDV